MKTGLCGYWPVFFMQYFTAKSQRKKAQSSQSCHLNFAKNFASLRLNFPYFFVRNESNLNYLILNKTLENNNHINKNDKYNSNFNL